MSLLSEALERQLRKIQAPEAPKAPLKAPATTTKSIHLVYQEGTSDKEYLVQVVEVENGWEVHFQYGRRGKTLIKGTKTPSPVPFTEAIHIYDKLVGEKLIKGYERI